MMKRKIPAFLLCMAMLSSAAVPGTLAIESDADSIEMICEQEEHTHNEECFGESGYVCRTEEHIHAVECYMEQMEYVHDFGTDAVLYGADSSAEWEPEEQVIIASYAVGDQVWLKKGTVVYQNAALNSDHGYELAYDHQVEITDVKENEDCIWYKFDPEDIDEYNGHKYKWVPEEDISAERPEDSDETEAYECNCEYPAENLAHHPNSCPRKEYVKTLFMGKSADELYAVWADFDAELQKDFLDMLQAWDAQKYDRLQELLGKDPGDPEDPVEYPEEYIESINEIKSADDRNEILGILKDLNGSIDDKYIEKLREELAEIPSVFEIESEDRTFDVSVKGNIPLAAEVDVDPVPMNDDELAERGFSFCGHDNVLAVLDVTIYDEDNGEWQPMDEDETITISFEVGSLGLAEGDYCAVYHIHNDEEIVTLHLVDSEGYVNYETDRLSPMAIAYDYPLDGNEYDSSKIVYWDVAERTSGGFPTHKRGDANKVVNVFLNKTKVAKGNSAGKSPSQWKIEVAKSLSNYYPGTRVGSKNDTSDLTITPAPGYYVTGVTVACTAAMYDKWNGMNLPYAIVVMDDAYHCGTWKSGHEYTESLTYESTGAVTIDIPSEAFCHMSNGMENIGVDKGDTFPERTGGTNEYFILIEVAPVPSPLFVEYQCGTIKDNSSDPVFNDPSLWVTKDGRNDGTLNVDTPNTQYKYHYSEGLSEAERAAEAAKWEHFAGEISGEALSAALAAGYKFTGWKATYYTQCNATQNSSPNPNYYNYSFSSQLGEETDIKAKDNVPLHTHVKLVAQWERIQTKTLTVNKVTVNDPDSDASFDFSLTLDNSANDFDLSSISYIKGSTNGVRVKNDKGEFIFSLKKDESITFTLPSGVKYKITEKEYEQYVTTVSGDTEDTLNSNTTVTFTNTRNTVSLTIKKIVAGETPDGGVEYPVKVLINGEPFNGNGISDGELRLKAGDIYVITDLPVGTKYSVAEIMDGITPPSGYDFKPPVYTIDSASGTETAPSDFDLLTDTVVTITNELYPVYGDLTITKKGISNVDNNTENGETQSTIYTVVGPDGTEKIKLQVVIVGNSSITIKDLPVGEYTVTEVESWSWRYEEGNLEPEKSAEVKAGETEVVKFVNKRKTPQWLSGDCYVENWFTKSENDQTVIKKRDGNNNEINN